MDTNQSIPLFIVSFNRLGYLRTLIGALEEFGFQNITIVDNASTYEPLVEYLEQSPHRVERMPENLGHLALWKSGRFDNVIMHQRFILTDCDVMPAPDCPKDITALLNELLERYPRHTKAGLSLKIDDLPDHYAFKKQVIEWELPFWEHRLEDGHYEGAIDTTFALYRPGIHCSEDRWWRSIRTAPPYSALHLPWYQDTGRPTEEDLFYQGTVVGISSQWSITDPVLLKNQNTELQHEIASLKKQLVTLRMEVEQANASLTWRNLVRNELSAAGLLPAARRVRELFKARK